MRILSFLLTITHILFPFLFLSYTNLLVLKMFAGLFSSSLSLSSALPSLLETLSFNFWIPILHFSIQGFLSPFCEFYIMVVQGLFITLSLIGLFVSLILFFFFYSFLLGSAFLVWLLIFYWELDFTYGRLFSSSRNVTIYPLVVRFSQGTSFLSKWTNTSKLGWKVCWHHLSPSLIPRTLLFSWPNQGLGHLTENPFSFIVLE